MIYNFNLCDAFVQVFPKHKKDIRFSEFIFFFATSILVCRGYILENIHIINGESEDLLNFTS